ncbi:sensor histidine kinase [Streptomyces sp. NPDC001046]|uniref:sensor histidine kinase n=1 Tax=Streptomyces sp. NPDC001046 TaxID=3364543 RepID=UPI0036BB0122
MEYRRSMPARDRRLPDAAGPVGQGLSALSRIAPWVWAASLLVVQVLTLRPLGFSGQGLAVTVLMVVNFGFFALRLVPERHVPHRLLLPLLTAGVVAAVAMVAVADTGTSTLFAFFLAAYIGYRLDVRPATVLAVVMSLACGIVLVTRAEAGQHGLSLMAGLSTGALVLAGMSGRSRAQAVEAALEAAESSERAAKAEARALVLTERSRVARDVHDVLAHSLSGINMQLELADALIEAGDPEQARQATAQAQSLVKESLKQAQWTVRALREESLPLVETLTAMLESSGHRQALTVTGAVRELPAQTAHNLVRIAQEALTNATRHAPGGKVTVTLAYGERTTALSILNGPATVPVSAGAGMGSGMGLIGMRERVALMNGTITTGPVASGPHQGWWKVETVIPV